MREDGELSEAVQRALLPASLPEIPGWAMATLYEPAGAELLVGGDFYDWFRRPDGTVAVVLGDVMGKGSVAAALGMSVRKGLKALAFAVPTVEEGVTVLEMALEDELGGALVSFCYVELSELPSVGIFSVGHPPPWLLRDGVASEVDVPHNLIFGVGPVGPVGSGRRSSMSRTEVRSGDLLVFYSDGLSEARLRDGSQFGEGPFQEFLAARKPGGGPVDLVMELSEKLHDTVGELQDDLVVVVLGRV